MYGGPRAGAVPAPWCPDRARVAPGPVRRGRCCADHNPYRAAWRPERALSARPGFESVPHARPDRRPSLTWPI